MVNKKEKQYEKHNMHKVILPFVGIVLVFFICAYVIDNSGFFSWLPVFAPIAFLVLFIFLLAILQHYRLGKANQVLKDFALQNNLALEDRKQTFLSSKGQGDLVRGLYKNFTVEIWTFNQPSVLWGLSATLIRIDTKLTLKAIFLKPVGKQQVTHKQLNNIPAGFIFFNNISNLPSKEVPVEDKDFVRKYVVFSDDQYLVRSILTEDMRRKLMKFNASILAGPEGIYYAKDTLPESLQEMKEQVDLVIEIASKIKASLSNEIS
jgi:hypothetical protein